MKIKRKHIVIAGLVALAGGICVLAAIIASAHLVRSAASGRIYSDLEEVPSRRVGLILGCSRTLPDGRRNLFFAYRIDAAVELYEAGKLQYLLVSGDNHVKGYNEPAQMKEALLEHGVPEAAIQCDYAGFSTLDSVVRAREVFGQDRLTIISQEFHARRAVFVAQSKGIDAVGYCARDVTGTAGFKTHLREHLARVKAVMDVYVLKTAPRFLGEPIEIGKSKGTNGQHAHRSPAG